MACLKIQAPVVGSFYSGSGDVGSIWGPVFSEIFRLYETPMWASLSFTALQLLLHLETWLLTVIAARVRRTTTVGN